VLPGLDHRWHWSAVPAWLVLVANAGVALTFVIFFIVLKQNRYALQRSGSKRTSR